MIPCRGVWYGGKNSCECPCCRRVKRARGDYINANERVQRLHVREASLLDIVRAEVQREDAATTWQNAAQECDARTVEDERDDTTREIS